MGKVKYGLDIHQDRIYATWQNIRQRCCNRKHSSYFYYGARGVKLCKEWEDYLSFREWSLNNGYDDNSWLMRNDFLGNYEPNNCTWENRNEAFKDRVHVSRYEYNGETHTIKEWSEIIGISKNTLRARLYTWDSIEMALSTPLNGKHKELNTLTVNGETHTFSEWSEITKIPESTLRSRWNKWKDAEKVVCTKGDGRVSLSNLYEYNGEKHTINEWSEIYGLDKHLLRNRLQRMSIDEALTLPLRKRR